MAKYSIELKDIVETHNIFDFSYPFYDENKRAKFEEDFIRHFYFREIGTDTIDSFIHYLQDKMLTVFPYYNKLFEASTIEYSILDNYKVQETHTLTRDSDGKASGYSYSVGSFQGQHDSNSQTDTTAETTETGKDTENTVSTGTETENTTNTTNKTGTADTTTTDSKTGTATSEKETSNNETKQDEINKKFLDTPQGLSNLTGSKYLTSVNQDTSNSTINGTITENAETSTTENGNSTTDTDTTEESTSETDRTLNTTGETDRELSRNTTVTNDTTGNTATTATEEQKTTQDNNTRTYRQEKQTEKFELLKVGNIGVDTDSDMIEKHIRLQKTLTQIEHMFFNECEDLFMLVY